MEDFELIGYCGVDCSACPDLASGACPGCRKSIWPDGDACPPVSCCQEKRIEACGLCSDFPCAMMAEFYEESESHREALDRMRRLQCCRAHCLRRYGDRWPIISANAQAQSRGTEND